jgi:hypothetical protein
MTDDPALTSKGWGDSIVTLWIAWGIVFLLYGGLLFHFNFMSND